MLVRSQSSGQVEQMNRILRDLNKIALETGVDWVALLPFALFRVRNPYQMGLTPYEIIFGRVPPPIVSALQMELLANIEEQEMLKDIKKLHWAHTNFDLNLGPFMNLVGSPSPP